MIWPFVLIRGDVNRIRIGARSVPEIAVSIMAQFIEKRASLVRESEPADLHHEQTAGWGRVLHDDRYVQAGLCVLDAIFDEPYLSADDQHQGLLLHSVYHWPNRWDHVPPGSRVPYGESSQWGDYHAREAALKVIRPGVRASEVHNSSMVWRRSSRLICSMSAA